MDIKDIDIKNIILSNYSTALLNMITSLVKTISTMGGNLDENVAIIRTLNVQIESIRSETVLIQKELDEYSIPN